MLKPLTTGTLLLTSLAAALSCAPLRAEAPTASLQNTTITLPDSRPRPPFRFDPADAAFLQEIQHGAFNFLWSAVSPATGMVYDRSDVTVISIGGVGFQLSAIPVGIERGWITRDQGEARTLQILRALEAAPDNRIHGLFFHFLDPITAGYTHQGYERIVSTVDSALFFAGAITAGSYFGGEIADIASRLFAEADWTFFLAPDSAAPHERGFISLGWKATGKGDDITTGELLPFYWIDTGDEQLLTTFLAVAAPNPEYRVDPSVYYRLRRRLGTHGDIGPFVWFPWSGSLFTNVFAHCWIDYAHLGVDDPQAAGVDHRSRVDWWANSAMAVEMHRAKAIENPKGLPTLGPNAWGLTSCDFAGGYLVPSLFPDDVAMPGATPEMDYSTYVPTEQWGDGTVATYGAAMAILFDPSEAIAALRHYRDLASTDRLSALWADPATGGFGFADSFNEGTGWVSPLHFAIDAGPIVLAIENARTGLVTREFHKNPAVRAACDRLGLPAPR